VEDGEAFVDKQLQLIDVIQELLVLKRELVIILQTSIQWRRSSAKRIRFLHRS
jgi:hypothetical protein